MQLLASETGSWETVDGYLIVSYNGQTICREGPRTATYTKINLYWVDEPEKKGYVVEILQ